MSKAEAAGIAGLIGLAGLATFGSFLLGFAVLTGIIMGIGTYVFGMHFVLGDWIFWSVVPSVCITVVYGVVFWIMKS